MKKKKRLSWIRKRRNEALLFLFAKKCWEIVDVLLNGKKTSSGNQKLKSLLATDNQQISQIKLKLAEDRYLSSDLPIVVLLSNSLRSPNILPLCFYSKVVIVALASPLACKKLPADSEVDWATFQEPDQLHLTKHQREPW